MINLELPADGAGAKPPETIRHPLMEDPMTELLSRALGNEKGLRLTYPSRNSAISKRHQFYKHMVKLRNAGIQSFGNVSITIDDCAMTIQNVAPLKIEDL